MMCNDYERWLDEGSPERERIRMTAHAVTCVDCRREQRAALELERLLAIATPRPVDGRVHEAILREIRNAPSSPRTSPQPSPHTWPHQASPLLDACIQLFAEPLVPISIGVACVFAATAAMIHDAASVVSQEAVPALLNLPPAVALSAASLLGWTSWRLFRDRLQ